MASLWSCMVLFLTITSVVAAELKPKGLRVGYYRYTCPSAEAIVRKTVETGLARNPGLAAGLIRMHFHDCFVRGCDASVLLDSTPKQTTEKDSFVNNPSLRGFEIIDRAKSLIESHCPRTVSCSDILAFAARDAASISGGIHYQLPSGRRDGRISIDAEALQNLPSPFSNATQLIQSFARKGLSMQDMVILSGAHSIGVSHCSSFAGRLYSFNATHAQDPSMDRAFAAFMKLRCPPGSASRTGPDPTVPLDYGTPNRLDNVYYKNLRKNRGLLTSDQTLMSHPSTASVVAKSVGSPADWAAKFGATMVRMGSMDVLTGKKGEVRLNCRVVN
ncbi:Peroxidase 5 [Acorus gramineus]|uniref:Peroxidase n=1 Tax=Acorus gramineus TaxID=55184 RepID=A0AAV9BQS4_ACOGR|nr:Peroxidase 5 [Acorus gramineus]